MFGADLVTLIGMGCFAFIGWLVKHKFNTIDDLDNRLTKVETKLDVLGDISKTLNELRTDVEVIKNSLEHKQ